MFISTTAVFLAELVKLVTCLGLVWNSEDRDVGRYEGWNTVSGRGVSLAVLADHITGVGAFFGLCC